MVNIYVSRIDGGYQASIVSKNRPLIDFCAGKLEEALKRALLHAYNENQSTVEITSTEKVTVAEAIGRLFKEIAITVDPSIASKAAKTLLQIEASELNRMNETREQQRMMAPPKMEAPRFEDYATLPPEILATVVSMYPPHVRDFVESYDVKRSNHDAGWTIKHDPIPPMRTWGSDMQRFTGVHAELQSLLKEMDAGPEMKQYFGRAGKPESFPGSPEKALSELTYLNDVLKVSNVLQNSKKMRKTIKKKFPEVWRSLNKTSFHGSIQEFKEKQNEFLSDNELDGVLKELRNLFEKSRNEIFEFLKLNSKRTQQLPYSTSHFLPTFYLEGECPGCLCEIAGIPAAEAFCPDCGWDLDPKTYFDKYRNYDPYKRKALLRQRAAFNSTINKLIDCRVLIAGSPSVKLLAIRNSVNCRIDHQLQQVPLPPCEIIARKRDELALINDNQKRLRTDLEGEVEEIRRRDPEGNDPELNSRLNQIQHKLDDQEMKCNAKRRDAHQGIAYWEKIEREYQRWLPKLIWDEERQKNTAQLSSFAGIPKGGYMLYEKCSKEKVNADFEMLFDLHASRSIDAWLERRHESRTFDGWLKRKGFKRDDSRFQVWLKKQSLKYDDPQVEDQLRKQFIRETQRELVFEFVRYRTGVPPMDPVILALCSEILKPLPIDAVSRKKRLTHLHTMLWALLDPRISSSMPQLTSESAWYYQPQCLDGIYRWAGGKSNGKFTEAVLLPRKLPAKDWKTAKEEQKSVKAMLYCLMNLLEERPMVVNTIAHELEKIAATAPTIRTL
jgi:hypothetical protein